MQEEIYEFGLPQTPWKKYPQENWKEYLPKTELKRNRRYAVSDMGRVASFYKALEVDGALMKVSVDSNSHMGYFRVTLFEQDEETKKKKFVFKNIRIHKAIMEAFSPTDDPTMAEVIHLDFDRANNHISNLKWSTTKGLKEHYLLSPNPDHYKNARKARHQGHKLNSSKVKIIKKKLQEGKTRQRILAKQFGVSTTVIEHIKSGKYWSHVKIDED
jgi:hypothetical protein